MTCKNRIEYQNKKKVLLPPTRIKFTFSLAFVGLKNKPAFVVCLLMLLFLCFLFLCCFAYLWGVYWFAGYRITLNLIKMSQKGSA